MGDLRTNVFRVDFYVVLVSVPYAANLLLKLVDDLFRAVASLTDSLWNHSWRVGVVPDDVSNAD